MEEGSYPIIIAALSIVICILIIILIANYIFYRKKNKSIVDTINAANGDFTEEDIITLVKEGHEQGVLEENEVKITRNSDEYKNFHGTANANIKNMIEGVGGKTLFLKDKNNYYLYLLDDERQANLKFLSKSLNIGRLSFGNEDELYDKLKLKKGSVTPLGIINDNSSVILIIDKTLKGKKILTHPNINTATVSIRYDDLIKFIKYCNNTYYEV